MQNCKKKILIGIQTKKVNISLLFKITVLVKENCIAPFLTNKDDNIHKSKAYTNQINKQSFCIKHDLEVLTKQIRE